MIHANRRWPEAISPNLWPYAVRMANEMINITPSLQDTMKRSPMQIFSRSKVNHNTKHQMTFGCPAYVLDNTLQQKGIFHKWNQRSRVGVYLGRSPQHAKNVSLILDRMTGLVSPQFHVQFDNRFETTKQEWYESKWQIKAGFVSEPRKRERKDGKHEISKRRIISEEYEAIKMNRERSNAERDERIRRRNIMRQSYLKGNQNEGPGQTNPEGEGENVAEEIIEADEEIGEIMSFESLFPHEEH